jgi:hypothetical protein
MNHLYNGLDGFLGNCLGAAMILWTISIALSVCVKTADGQPGRVIFSACVEYRLTNYRTLTWRPK